ncbi:M48 family metalloprotease [Chitinophagaceae bacterium LB-8]|uniref:M48 family metalloprotease n=1 Tax=Paraflavisolibacter caeni TaxID=2982496 RepID=A0A9X3BGX0_9BACT|nr:M48 family metalloprotease [Paraflavisolibacter caeni]MCU7551619.1 M48 family metalloprotease [Paraflavisolibacter caeni]
MKRILLILGLFVATLAGAQKVNQCGIIVPPPSTRSSFSSVYEAKQYISTMLDRINWQENFSLREQNGINNAYATILQGRRYIIYDNNFLENLDSYAGTKWASISVLAHEMGHHYRNHVISSSGSTPPKEIEADYFSGYVMAKLGATLNEARAAMEQIASPMASASHPAKADRLTAITQGWNYANGISNETKPAPPAPQPQQNPPPATNDASWIYLSLYSNQEMTVYLSDNGRDFTEAPLKTDQPFVFKFEVYNYGWLRFSNSSNARSYKLYHGKDYAIVWSRRSNNWTVVEVP